jgi:prepilin-type N-terminal cleavage/methylation domain-containing protein
MRAGVTLPEISAVLAILAVIAGFALPRFSLLRDRVATDAAATATVALLASARHAAVRRGSVTAVSFDTASGTVTIAAGADTIERRALGAVHGVRLAVTRDSIAYAPNGMGYGAANTRLILRRGASADTLFVSRLGRTRR